MTGFFQDMKQSTDARLRTNAELGFQTVIQHFLSPLGT
jgi:hypothetical protein